MRQSPSLKVLSQRKVGDTLKLMNRSRAETLTPDLARQVCLRTLSKALLRGSISDKGNQYVIALAVVDCQTGDTLASTTVEAEHWDQVIHTLGEAATRLRINLGDSSATDDKYNRPLELEATPSLDALEAYMEGVNANGPSEFCRILSARSIWIRTSLWFTPIWQATTSLSAGPASRPRTLKRLTACVIG